MADAKAQFALPTIAFPEGFDASRLSGLVIGVVPHLDPRPSEVQTILDAMLARPDAPIPHDLKTILQHDEVMYLVIGKWPPDYSGHGAPPDSISAGPIMRAVHDRVPLSVVVGPWDFGRHKVKCPKCKHEFEA